MAIKVGGTTVIDDSRALNNITSVDATTVAALGTAGIGGGGGIELIASEALAIGDNVAFNFDTGKVEKISRTGGTGSNSGYSIYDSTQSNTSLQVFDVISIPSINKIAIIGTGNTGNNVTVMVGEINASGGYPTWGTSWYGDFNSQVSGAKLVYDESASRLVAIYQTSNGHMMARSFSISGNNVTAVSNTTITTVNTYLNESESQVAAVYSPTHQRIIVAYYTASAPISYRIQVGNVGASSITWSSAQGPTSGYLSIGGTYTYNVGIAVNGSTIVFAGRQASTGDHFAFAATMSGSTLSFGTAHTFDLGTRQNTRAYLFHVSHSNQNSNRFAYGGQNASRDSVMHHFDVSGTTISNSQTYTLNGSSGLADGFAYAYDPDNNRTYVINRHMEFFYGSDPSDMRQGSPNGSNAFSGSSSNLIRSAGFDPSSGFSFAINSQNPTKLYTYGYLDDNYQNFVGIVQENVSANSTVKIANAGSIATGLSGLTPGRLYRIKFDGTFQGITVADDYSNFNEAQRARLSGRALTASTMLMLNDFMYN
jgi:hypothetical protein